MTIFTSLENIQTKPTAVAMGLFDGVHIGHQAVISKAVDALKEDGLVPAVFTFTTGGTADTSPRSKINSRHILTKELKAKRLAELGIETVFDIPFQNFRGLTPEQFIKDVVIDKFRAKRIICGFNFRFGKNACAGVEEMIDIALRHGVEVIEVQSVEWNGDTVSSTRIRNSLLEGDMTSANAMLDSTYSIRAEVMLGNKLGRTIQFPTINQYFEPNQLIPCYGVYASYLEIDEKIYVGITNIGTKPTVGKYDPLAETHIFNFSGDLYGKVITMSLLEFVRPERKFDSLELLKQQISRDAAAVQYIYKKYAKTALSDEKLGKPKVLYKHYCI